jgi:predicted amidophosphoribosyltransferase
MKETHTKQQPPSKTQLSYYLCPRCQRAVPAEAGESYCVNDGAPLLQACNHCGAAITSPYSSFCKTCGKKLSFIEERKKL